MKNYWRELDEHQRYLMLTVAVHRYGPVAKEYGEEEVVNKLIEELVEKYGGDYFTAVLDYCVNNLGTTGY